VHHNDYRDANYRSRSIHIVIYILLCIHNNLVIRSSVPGHVALFPGHTAMLLGHIGHPVTRLLGHIVIHTVVGVYLLVPSSRYIIWVYPRYSGVPVPIVHKAFFMFIS
jgi:hypothetical protein